MSRVWEKSQHGGANLLMLLAIADFSDDRGRAYPSVNTLAQKCRVKPRAANYSIAELRDSGELRVFVGKGPRGCNLFQIALDRLGLQSSAGVQEIAEVQSDAGMQEVAPLQKGARTPAISCAAPLHPVAPKPSLNHQEPSKEAIASVGKTDLPACRTQDVVDAYHAALPELPAVRLMNDGRRKTIAKLWTFALTSKKSDGSRRAKTADEALVWIKTYFERARDNDFLMGRGTKAPGHEGWRCDLDFLLTNRGMKHVIERTEVPQ